MAEITTPDDALKAWREQIAENDRLRRIVVACEEKIAELAQLNREILFEAQRYKEISDTVTLERDYLLRSNESYRAKLEVTSNVASDVAATIANLSSLALDYAAPRPEPISAPPVQEAQAEPRQAVRDLPELQPSIEDDHMDLPIFLKTPLPEVRLWPNACHIRQGEQR